MYEPDVTIITPTKNIVDEGKADDFTLLINLLNLQTYEFVDHLIVDGGSTDGTDVLLKEYKNLGYISFFSEPDNGKFSAMNKGILRAKGKYVSFLSCDDFYHDITAIADIVNAMEETDADFCFFPSYCRHPEGYVFRFDPSIYNVFQVSPCPRQAVFFKKSALSKIGAFDEKFKLLADYDLMIRLMLNGCQGIYFDGNVVTCKLGEQVMKHATQVEAETSHIYYKNYKPIYPITNEEIDRMVKFSEIPRQLLAKFAASFPKEDSEEFYTRYQQMYDLRMQAIKAQREQNRRPR
jgi:glycosyltransferase involved in cell wall biosynthesis